MKISADDLRLVRGHLDLTQAEMADHLGVSPRTVVNWETSGVPDSKVSRVNKVVGRDLEEVRHLEAFIEATKDDMPTDEQYQQWINESDERTEPAQIGMTADQRRSHLLQAFTDVDLINELKDRALRRGERGSLWNAERMERYQRFVAPRWQDPDYSNMSEQDAKDYGLAAKRADPNIGDDDLPNEP